MHYLWFDTETGGLDAEKHTLLTAYFAICNKDLVIIDELYLQLKPEDTSKISVTEGAMKVNNINLQEHLADPNTLTYEKGKEKLMTMLSKHKIPRKRKSYQPCGHNISFDKNFIWSQLVDQETWESIVHYRDLDTSSVCSFLKDVDILPEDLGQLTSLVEYFELPLGEAHNARGDVLMNIEVYKAIRSLMKIKKEGMVGAVSSSLLEIIER